MLLSDDYYGNIIYNMQSESYKVIWVTTMMKMMMMTMTTVLWRIYETVACVCVLMHGKLYFEREEMVKV